MEQDTENDDPDALRRQQEFDALVAFYGSDTVIEKPGGGSDSSWTIAIRSDIVLRLRLPSEYPSIACPNPTIQAPSFVLDASRRLELEQALQDMFVPGEEVAIMWTEHCRAVLLVVNDDASKNEDAVFQSTPQVVENDDSASGPSAKAKPIATDDDAIQTFLPPTSKYGQTTRHFSVSVITNPANQRIIHSGPPFHPPSSGPGETFIAHVASVQNMHHVDWVLAQLLFHNKRVAKATHNMMAYRFQRITMDTDNETTTNIILVSDNDDDGETGAGAKLANLLELTRTQNVLVVVSRWFGGTKLGSSRFKYIAQVARSALDEFGFLEAR